LAVIGYTAWHPAVQVTPFLRYLNEQGLQFGFALIKDPENVPFNFCYSSNLSVPRQWLPADPFDEAFPYAAWEDVELGYRLSRQGLQLVYASDAIVRHRHLVRFEAFAQRQEKAGRSAVIFYRKHLELGAFLGVSESGPPDLPPVWYRRILYRMACLCEYGPERFAPLWKGVLRHHYLKGLHEGWSDV
jgi:GT2 family glycosyltransferase